MNSKLEAVAAKAAEILKSSIAEADPDILAAWDVVAEEAQANDANPVLSLGFTIKLDLGANKMTTALAFSVRRKFETACDIPDPNQTELPIGETGESGVEMFPPITGGGSITVSQAGETLLAVSRGGRKASRE